MNAGDTNVANQMLSTKMASRIYVDQAVFYIQNTAVAFVCNQGSSPVDRINMSPVADYAWQITEACGWFVAGIARMDESGPVDYGYMVYDYSVPFGMDFCANGEESNQHSC
jgi:hypothetical protein